MWSDYLLASLKELTQLYSDLFSQHRMVRPTHTVTFARGVSNQPVFIAKCAVHVSYPHTPVASNMGKVYVPIFQTSPV